MNRSQLKSTTNNNGKVINLCKYRKKKKSSLKFE